MSEASCSSALSDSGAHSCQNVHRAGQGHWRCMLNVRTNHLHCSGERCNLRMRHVLEGMQLSQIGMMCIACTRTRQAGATGWPLKYPSLALCRVEKSE